MNRRRLTGLCLIAALLLIPAVVHADVGNSFSGGSGYSGGGYSGGGYSDKINASVMAGGLPDVLTVDGPNVAAYASNGIIQPLAELKPIMEGMAIHWI